MARNRRKVEGEVTFSWIAARLMLFVMVVGLFLGIVLMKNRNLKMGDELRTIDQELQAATQKTAGLEAQLARSRTPHELEAKVKAWRISMVRPAEIQIRRLRDPSTAPDVNSRARMLAQADAIRSSTPDRNR